MAYSPIEQTIVIAKLLKEYNLELMDRLSGVYVKVEDKDDTYMLELIHNNEASIKKLSDGKVDKIDGMGLSENNFTDALRDKLESIDLDGTYVADWTAKKDEEGYIKNKPEKFYDDSFILNMIDTINGDEDTFGSILYFIANAEHVKKTVVTTLPAIVDADKDTLYILEKTDSKGTKQYEPYCVHDDKLVSLWQTIQSIYDSADLRYVQLENVDTALSDTSINPVQNKVITAKINEVESIAKGKNQAHIFATTADMYAWISNADNVGKASVGDNFYILDIDVPDWWVSSTLLTPDSKGYYYSVAELETQKVDLTTITDLLGSTDISKIGDGTVTGAIFQINNDLSDHKEEIVMSDEGVHGLRYDGDKLYAKDSAGTEHVVSSGGSGITKEIVTVLPSVEDAKEDVLYILKLTATDGSFLYSPYMLIDGELQLVGSTGSGSGDASFKIVTSLPTYATADDKTIYIYKVTDTDGNSSYTGDVKDTVKGELVPFTGGGGSGTGPFTFEVDEHGDLIMHYASGTTPPTAYITDDGDLILEID